jgi:hypothetical protein
LQLGLSDLKPNLLLPIVQVDTKPGGDQLVPDSGRIVPMPIGNRENYGLDGRQPQGPGPRKVLNQQGQKALEAAENGPVDDDRPMFLVVGAHIFEVEVLGLRVVELNGRALPLPADRIGDVEIYLRSVERAVALVDRVGDCRRLRVRASSSASA